MSGRPSSSHSLDSSDDSDHDEPISFFDFLHSAGGTVPLQPRPFHSPAAVSTPGHTGDYRRRHYSDLSGRSSIRVDGATNSGRATTGQAYTRHAADMAVGSSSGRDLTSSPSSQVDQPGPSRTSNVRLTQGPPREDADSVSRPTWPLQRNQNLNPESRAQWQPDAEVTSCPVCRSDFGFWYRKHHCRKCGRVVCAACSPHRITIPRQFIVRPPDATEGEPFSPGANGSPKNLGGGEVVRVCNPCVPDPWMPPPTRRRTQPDPQGRREGLDHHPTFHPDRTVSARSRMRANTHQPSATYSRSVPHSGIQIPHRTVGASALSRPSHRHTQSSAPTPRPSAVHQVNEEDECPICGREMAPGSRARELHIEACIATRSKSSAVRGMAVYRATEKDCVDAEGAVQECIICFEEFQPGDDMGRMECLCKFHRLCIRQWWEAKGGGSCPTHQLHG